MIKTKIIRFLTFQRILALVTLVVLIILGAAGPSLAQSFIQGYQSDAVLQKGMLVRLNEGDTTKVSPVSSDEMDKLHGVIVNPNDAPVTLSDIAAEKVFVATQGRHEVLVSNQNGGVNEGDFITVSALSGVGMKAGDSQEFIVGRAVEAFNDSGPSSSKAKIKDSEGQEREVSLGRVDVEINIGRNPLLKGDEANLPEFLKKASETIAGKPVDTYRVYLAIIVFIITTVVAGSLLYGGVRSGLISIGRNPLSKGHIIRGMFQIVITGIIIFILGLFGVYLLLKL